MLDKTVHARFTLVYDYILLEYGSLNRKYFPAIYLYTICEELDNSLLFLPDTFSHQNNILD